MVGLVVLTMIDAGLVPSGRMGPTNMPGVDRLPPMFAFPFTSSFAPGLVVPMPTLPFLSTIKLVAVELPPANAGCPAIEFTDNCAHGVVVAPIPSLLFTLPQKKFEEPPNADDELN